MLTIIKRSRRLFVATKEMIAKAEEEARVEERAWLSSERLDHYEVRGLRYERVRYGNP